MASFDFILSRGIPNRKAFRPYSILRQTLLCFAGLGIAFAGEAPVEKPDAEAVRAEYLEYLRETKGVVEIRTVHDSGSGPGAFNLMVVSAGFAAKDAADFFNVCDTLARTLLSEEPWKKYAGMVNIHGILVDDESPAKTRVQVGGYEGQILGCQNQPAIQFGNYAGKSDNTIVVHNSGFSTPTCGPWAMVTCHRGTAGNYRTLHHELGHSIGGLGDKYTQRPGRYDGSIKNLWEGKNATDQPDPLRTQWHYWTQDFWPGAFSPLKIPKTTNVVNYEGAAWAKGFYRPEEKCVMHGGDSPTYCTICSEIMETCFFRTINQFELVSPPAGERVLWKGETETFKLKALKFIREPRPWMKSSLEFHVDGKQVAASREGVVEFEFGGKTVTPGYHQIGANLTVQAEYVRRDDGFLGASKAWRVKVMPYEKPRLKLPPSVVGRQGQAIRVPVLVEHSRKDLLEIRMSHAPEGATLQGGSFDWRAPKPGAWLVDFTVLVDKQEALTESLVVLVKGASAPIEIKALTPVDALVGKESVIQIDAVTGEGAQPLYQLLNPLEGMNLDRASGKLVWTPRLEQYGPHRLRFRVSNGSNHADGSVLIGVCKEAAPYLNSYLTTYNKDRNQWLKDHKDSPITYGKIFEISRMFRERFSDIYTPALAEAKVLYAELNPGMREAFLQELTRHVWTFVDRPAILEWLTEISKASKSPQAMSLRKELYAIRLWAKVKELEQGGNPKYVGSLLAQIPKSGHVSVRSAIRRAVKSLYQKAANKEAFREIVRSAMQRSKDGELAAMIPMVVSVEMPGKEEILLKAAADPNEEVAGSATEALEKIAATGTETEIAAVSKLLIKSPSKLRRAVISRFLVAISLHLNDLAKSQQAMLAVLETETGPGRVDLFRLLPLVREPKLIELLDRFSANSDVELAQAARRAQQYMKEEIGMTEAFVASWQLAGPYPMGEGTDVFPPEKNGKADWKPFQCPQQSGARVVPLKEIFGGDNRVAYMKATVRSKESLKVLFGAGSDDSIDVWLNGKLIHSQSAMRAVKADEDRFTGTLKAGENVILCKVKQFSQGWAACLTIRAADGGPALGVTVSPP